jgi:hypothetical protein
MERLSALAGEFTLELERFREEGYVLLWPGFSVCDRAFCPLPLGYNSSIMSHSFPSYSLRKHSLTLLTGSIRFDEPGCLVPIRELLCVSRGVGVIRWQGRPEASYDPRSILGLSQENLGPTGLSFVLCSLPATFWRSGTQARIRPYAWSESATPPDCHISLGGGIFAWSFG